MLQMVLNFSNNRICIVVVGNKITDDDDDDIMKLAPSLLTSLGALSKPDLSM